MAKMNQTPGGSDDSLDSQISGNSDDSACSTPQSVTRLLDNSTVGVALFDKNLRCRAVNAALATMLGVSTEELLQKPLLDLFHSEAPQFLDSCQRIWVTGECLSNRELVSQLPAGSTTRRWLADFYPIKDDSRHVRLLAATFSEVTARHDVKRKLSRLRNKIPADAPGALGPLGEEFSQLSERTMDLLTRSSEILNSSASLRTALSVMRLEAGLERFELFLTGAPHQFSVSDLPLQSIESATSLPSPESTERTEDDLAVPSPSFRERQVLRLLADGKSNKEIGAVLEISTRTAESYRARILLKLDLHSTAALVRYAIRHKIIEA